MKRSTKLFLWLLPVGFVSGMAVGCESSSSSLGAFASAISPSPCVVWRTQSAQLSAKATMPDGRKQDITSSPSIDVTVVYRGATGTTNCTVALQVFELVYVRSHACFPRPQALRHETGAGSFDTSLAAINRFVLVLVGSRQPLFIQPKPTLSVAHLYAPTPRARVPKLTNSLSKEVL
jgi:hypothetical protein